MIPGLGRSPVDGEKALKGVLPADGSLGFPSETEKRVSGVTLGKGAHMPGLEGCEQGRGEVWVRLSSVKVSKGQDA